MRYMHSAVVVEQLVFLRSAMSCFCIRIERLSGDRELFLCVRFLLNPDGEKPV